MDFVVGHELDQLGPEIARLLDCKYRSFKNTYTPDGEPRPKVFADYDELEGADVLFCYRHRQYPDRDKVSRYWLNTQRVVEDLSSHETYNAASVDVLWPYFLFGRGDHNPRTDSNPMVREKDRGQGIGPNYVAKVLRALGANRLVTVNPHFHRDPGTTELEGLKIMILDGAIPLAEYAMKHGYLEDDCLVMSPDKAKSPLDENGNKSTLARRFAVMAGREYFGEFDKTRQDCNNVTRNGCVDACGRQVVLVDDIFSTLGTVETAVSNIVNASSIDIYGVHPVLPGEGFKRAQTHMNDKVRRIIGTNTIRSDYEHANIAPEVAKLYKDDL